MWGYGGVASRIDASSPVTSSTTSRAAIHLQLHRVVVVDNFIMIPSNIS